MNHFLRIYKLFISPVFAGLGGNCRFNPTCSEYACGAFARMSFWKALPIIGKRLLKCGPWHEGGIDKLEE